ncbi:MAG: hypothetical protein JXB62_20650 [Pirellulales bacterium]|nr:hypothetical protein [Pirellulales bacterium]
MATRFMRIDLSEEARDYRPLALEPGVPLLDRSNANAKILFRWLGGLIAEPSWVGDSVHYFAQHETGGRLEDVVCQPATRDDLDKLLKADLATLKQRISDAKPDTPTERALKKIVRQSFEGLTEDPHRTDLDSYFFRYRDVNGRWRLVWCWGYQRVDQEPAPAVVCTDPECNLLFVRRPGRSPKCPSCEAALATRPKRRRRWKRVLASALLLALFVGALVYWYLHPNRLIITPGSFAGPVGSRVEFRVEHTGLFPFLDEDVTSQAVGVVLDPAVAQFDRMASAATIVGAGRTLLRFHLGDLEPANVTLIAGPAKNPDRIVIEPGNVALGIGTTARLKLLGEFEDGTRVDLTDAAQWTVQSDEIVYSYEGLLEGVGEGSTTVAARYRASAQSEYLDATAAVIVRDIDFTALEMYIDPVPVGAGRASRLQIDAVSKDDKRYRVLESSLLQAEIHPAYIAAVEGRHLKGKTPGNGKITVTFDETLTAGMAFSVVVGPGLDRLVVTPKKLDMVVGEITGLNVVSPDTAPIYVTSSDPSVVEITDENRLVGRGEGTVEVEVTQGNQRRSVPVTVTTAKFASIEIDPPRVVVPVDDEVRPRVLASIATETATRNVEIAPDVLTTEKAPSPRYAEFEAKSMRLHGVTPTDPSSPQTLVLRFGEHRSSAPVEVVVAPLRLSLTPAGPVDLPLGQQIRLQGWATYSGGRRVGVLADRLRFSSKAAEDAAPGLELRGGKVAALKPNAGPLEVHASYFGRNSRPVTVRSVEAGDVTLQLGIDRSLRLTGETGRVALTGTSPQGDVDLVPELAEFTSSDSAILKIDEKTGAFRAAGPGDVTVAANHVASTTPASLTLKVFDPAKARLSFAPPSARLTVDEVARLPLYLEVDDDGTIERARLIGPGVGYTVGNPRAIRWTPPAAVGVEPAAPFELRASYYPILGSTATAQIEVVAAVEPTAIRIVPSSASLAPGQTLPLCVEQQLPNEADVWREVRPEAVVWTVPPGLVWTPAAGGLRPAATGPEAATGDFELQAEFSGKQAVGALAMKPQGPDPNDPAAKVLLVREPPGEYLPVGSQQRYTIAVEKDDVVEPAAGIQWPADFENEYVCWQAPVLTARRSGFRQWFRAEVDGRAVLFHTSTYQPGRFSTPPAREGAPLTVKIVPFDLDEPGPGQLVRFPLGAEFDDFRVEAEFADPETGEHFTRYVTKQATLTTPQSADSAVVSAASGRLIGNRVGRTSVTAEFEGVRCQQPMEVEVTAELDIDRIAVVPSPITILPGETVPLDVVGYKNGKSVGIITGLGNVSWQAGNPQVASVVGSSVSGVAVGQGSVKAQLKGLVSEPAPVNVVPSIADALGIDPDVLRIGVGQSAQIGTHVSVLRGAMDLSRHCTVTPALPGVVQYVPQTHSLVGVSPGTSAVAFAFGDKLVNLMVEVLPSGGPIDGQVMVEPAAGNLARGQSLEMRVYVITPAGHRIDRTDSAVFSSSDSGTVVIQGNRVCAMSPGTATIVATLPGAQQTGSAYVTVNSEEISQLIVQPPQLAMSTGDVARIRILGQAPTGTHEMFVQPELSVTAGGQNPQAIQIIGAHDVGASMPGTASVAVNWQNRLSQQVPVTVTEDVLTNLRIEPAQAVIYPGGAMVYQVTGLKGRQRRVLRPEHGVRLFVNNPSVAQAATDELVVMGTAPGRTSVVATVGGQQAEAALDVTPGTGLVGGVYPGVPGGVDMYTQGFGEFAGPAGQWIEYGGWDGRIVLRGESGFDDGVVFAPSADVAELRFVPEVLRLSPGSPPTPVRVIELLADGSYGRDVTADPNLEIAQPPGVVAVEKTAAGPLVRPIGAGQTRVGAKLGMLTADPLLVSVGDATTVSLAQLAVSPQPLAIWSGEVGTFGSVVLDPGGGQLPREIDYRVSPMPNQNVVAASGERMIRGQSSGVTQVVVTAVDPGGPYDGLSTTAVVEVTSADPLSITPPMCGLQVGQATPPFAVTAHPPDGVPYQVPAVLQSTDPAILAPDAAVSGRFVGKTFGQTQVLADYRGRQAYATVTVSGKRFLNVIPTKVDEAAADFGVILRVLAAESEGPLQYRVYAPGETPAENWTDAELRDGHLEASLQSPRISRGPYGMQYHLVLEARNPSDGSVQQYQYKFQLVSVLKETDAAETAPNANNPF